MRRRRAYLLIEILVALSLMASFAAVGMRLRHTCPCFCATFARTASADHNALLRQERLVDQVGRDVWSAESIVVSADGRSVQLKQSDGTATEWRGGLESGLERVVADQPPQSWNGPGSFTFTAEGPVLVLRQERHTMPTVEIRLASELMMLKEGQP